MKILATLTAAVFLGIVIGCGGPPAGDTTGVAPPKSPEETQKDIEQQMKGKKMTPQTYGKPQPTKDIPPP